MTPLIQWAQRWGVPPQALAELAAITVPPPPPVPSLAVESEAGVMQRRRIVAAQRGARLWRNNVGACEDSTGRMIRYGLGNDSKQVNEVMKTSDLIGVTTVTCPCGHRYGVFTAEECKAPGWVFRQSDKRAAAQQNFLQLVTAMGGIGRFITDPEA